MIYKISAVQAIHDVILLASVYILFDSAEKIFSFSEYKKNGLYDWKAIRQSNYFAHRPKKLLVFLNLIFNYQVWLPVLVFRMSVALMLIICPLPASIVMLSLLSLFILGSLINFRNGPFGAETQNRFGLVIIGALLLYFVVPTALIAKAVLWFLALQACLSYFTAGFSKLSNAGWRKGYGLFNVVNSANLLTFKKYALFLNRYPSIGKITTWATLVMECLFPLVLIAGRQFVLVFLIWGLIFHLSIAILLRINLFFWVWIATYPAIFFIAQ